MSCWRALCTLVLLLSGSWLTGSWLAGQVDGATQAIAENQVATILPIAFPLTNTSVARLIETLERISSRSNGTDRPLVVMEFVSNPNTNQNADVNTLIGRGTSFERSLELARWLSGSKGSRIHSVAYLPSSIEGHAVLVALGCEEIAIADVADMGRAGIDESELDTTIRQAYLDVAARRSAFPTAAVLSFIDPLESLVRIVKKNQTTEYLTVPQLARQKRAEDVEEERQLVANNQMAFFSGRELRNMRWVAYTANDRDQLGKTLKLSKPITEQIFFVGNRVAIRLHLKGIVSNRHVNRNIRAIEEGLKNKDVNLIVIDLDSSGGNLSESLRLAQYLADIPNDRAEVACYIRGSALGDSALIPLGSDTILMHPDAKLGGPGEATISQAVCQEQKTALQMFAKSAGRSDGEVLGCICPDFQIFEYNTFDGRKQWSTPQWLEDDPVLPIWNQGDQISFRGGLGFDKANELGLVADKAVSVEAVGNRFGIDELPEEMQSNAIEQYIEWLAGQGWLSMVLFMVGIICLSAELSTPGMGIAGIMSAVCFLLFFWIHLFQGTVEWLEILLIAAGIVCLAIEMFVLPGFGVFGITGLILLAVGLLLAGQTFVFPTNEYQWQRTVTGIGQLGLIVLSLMGAAIVFRKQLANLPMVRWFALQPPTEDKELHARELIVEEMRSLLGWHGVTVSRCNPSGKASIGDRIFAVSSQDAWIDEDTEIEVVNIQGNTLIVRARAAV